VFCDAASGGNLLAYEFVPSSWSATAGTGEWYFLAPTIPKTSTTQFIYAIVGKASATDFSCLASGVTGCQSTLWNNFQLVYHSGYNNGSTHGLSETDSTGHATSPTDHGVVDGVNTTFPPVNEYFQLNNTKRFDTGYSLPVITNFSVETWVSNGFITSSQWTAGNIASLNGIGAVVVDGGGSCAATECIGTYYLNGSSHYYSKFTNASIGHASAWHQYVATHTGGSSNQLALYLDGATTAGNTYDSAGTTTNPNTSSSTFWVGVSGATPLGSNAGVNLDEFRLATFVLTADEILWDYTSQSGPSAVYTITVNASVAVRHRSQVF